MADENTLENLKKTLDEVKAELSKPVDTSERDQELKEQESRLKKIIEMDPGSDIAHHSLADNYMHQRRYDEAETEYKRAIEINPQHTFSHYDLAEFYFDHKRFEEAKSEYQRVVEIGVTTEIDDELYQDIIKDNIKRAKQRIAEIYVIQSISAAKGETDKDKRIESLRSVVEEFKGHIDSGAENLHVYTGGVVKALEALKQDDPSADPEELRQAHHANIDAESKVERDDSILDRLFEYAERLSEEEE